MSQAKTDTGPVKVALIGAGSMAAEHVRAFQALPGVRLAGIHSRTRSRAEALANEYGIESVHESIDELYAATQADLVIVAVPELQTLSVSESVFRHPWVSLFEKPVGHTLSEARQIAGAARATGSPVIVGLNRRFMSSTMAAQVDLDTRQERRYVRVVDQQNHADAAAIGHPAEVVRNWMFANSIHLVDYFMALCRGEVVRVERILPHNPSSPGVVLALVHFDSGDTGLYEGVWDGPGPWSVTVVTPSKRWEMRPLEKAFFQLRGERKLHEWPVDPVDERFKAGFHRQAEEALKFVRRETSRSPTLSDSLRTMELIDSIFEPR